MPNEITRDAALDLLAEHEMRARTAEEREDDLFCLGVEGWSDDAGWRKLQPTVREEIERNAEGQEISDPEHPRFDAAIALYFRGRPGAATNEYLLHQVCEIDQTVTAVTGVMPDAEACPCCGRKTIGERGCYEICRVCWWEDDGQDNDQADEVLGGPNGGVSLTEARRNFLAHGIFDPTRTDLHEQRDPPDMYCRGRSFALQEDGTVVELIDGTSG